MKKILLFYLLKVFFIYSIQAQWIEQNSGTNIDLTSVSFPSSNTGYAVGLDSSLILKSTNAGINWSRIYSGNLFWYTNYFLNDNTGFTGGINLIKTTNGGSNWLTVNYGTNWVQDVYFLNSQTGFLIPPSGGKIYRTTDNGNNWIEIANLGNAVNSKAVYFLNNNTGFVAGVLFQNPFQYQKIWKSTDGGITWVQKFTTTQTYQSTDYSNIVFIDNNNGYCAGLGENMILKTNNNGENWNNINVPTYSVNSMYCFSLDTIFICGDEGLYKTKNAGVNWELQLSGGLITHLRKLVFFNSMTGWVVGSHGKIYRTTNGGGFVGIQQLNNSFPDQFSLSQNYPNPFNPVTKIKFDVPANVKSQTSNVKLIIYDILGREVTTLVNEALKPGSYEAEWPATGGGSNFASGIYFYSLQTEEFAQTKKMVLMK